MRVFLKELLPSNPQERLRLLFFSLSLFAILVNGSRLSPAETAPWYARPLAMVALACLAVWWTRGYARRSFPDAALPFEGLAILAVCLGHNNAQASIGFLAVSLAFRAQYASGERALLPTVAYAGAYGLSLVRDASLGAASWTFDLAQLVAVTTVGVIMWLFAEALAKQEQLTNARLQALSDLNHFKDELLASVAHELRTPLTSIVGYSELLLTSYDPAVREEFLTIINSEGERLSRLVNNVLDVTKLQSGTTTWNMGTVDMEELLGDAARIYRPLIERAGLLFELRIAPNLPCVQGDRDKLLEVMGNLLSNAMKFTAKGTIGIDGDRIGGEVSVTVRDSGIGVAPESREQIFEKFHQVTSQQAGKPRGTGLGLAICRGVIEQHHGRIWADANVGGGSAFTFTLPTGDAEAES